jgi:hypothetical protein
VWHRGRGHHAFRYWCPEIGEVIDPERFVPLDPATPRPTRGEPIVCGTCGDVLSMEDLEIRDQ